MFSLLLNSLIFMRSLRDVNKLNAGRVDHICVSMIQLENH